MVGRASQMRNSEIGGLSEAQPPNFAFFSHLLVLTAGNSLGKIQLDGYLISFTVLNI
jgi:hypothetical protein